MAHFIGYLKGSRGEVSRLGRKTTGVDATARGWDIGGGVRVFHRNGCDHVEFVLNGGSNGSTIKDVAVYHINGGKIVEGWKEGGEDE